MEQHARPRAVTASRAATMVLLAVALSASAVAVATDLATLPHLDGTPFSTGWAGAAPGLAMLVPGALLLWQRPWHPIAVVLAGFGTLWALDGLASASLNWALLHDRGAWWAPAAYFFFARFGSVLILPVQLLLLLFPDGRLPARGPWRVVAVVSLVCCAVLPLVFVLGPSSVIDVASAAPQGWDTLPEVLPLPDPVWVAARAAVVPALVAGTLLALLVTISRGVGADAARRSQLRWLVWSGGVFVALATFSSAAGLTSENGGPGDVLLTLSIALLSASVVVAITRYRLYAIDRLLSWTLVYAVLVAVILLVDVVLVLAIGSVVDDRTAMLLAVIAVTLVYAPLRERMFALASRLVNGRRSDPYGVVSSLAGRLEEDGDTAGQLADVAEAIADAFASPYVRVELARPDGEPLVAEHGVAPLAPEHAAPDGATVEVPLEYRGAVTGRIVMQPGRRPRLSARDQALLGDIVRLAAAAMLNAELSTELQGIREGLVMDREEERSRLRRELHDGLGPLLGGIKLRLETARALAAKDPARAVAILDQAIADAAEVLAELRRLVDGLRPAALDDVGLGAAIEQQAARLRTPGLAIDVRADLPVHLPPAVDVAAFRIASEALTNVVRHADARHAAVDLRVDEDRLVIEVADDGTGIPAGAVHGVGLRSQRDRTAELGGDFALETPAGGGTRLVARLPLDAATDRATDRAAVR